MRPAASPLGSEAPAGPAAHAGLRSRGAGPTLAGPEPSVWRFAPSPNGYLHLGHAYSAILNFECARRVGGRMLLRIEDIDSTRARPQFEAAIYEDLAWLGIEWETPARRQSDCRRDYALALERLDAMGLLYPCYCSRIEIAEAVARRPDWRRDPDGAPLYPQTCRCADGAQLARFRADGRRPALRLKMDEALARIDAPLGWRECRLYEAPHDVRAEPQLWGDVVLGRRDIGASYHIAVVVDDALQGVTDVMRGGDLFANTSIHRLLQELLGLPAPVYRHHPLVRDMNGEKLSKSRFSRPLRELRAGGATPGDIRRMLGLDGPLSPTDRPPREPFDC